MPELPEVETIIRGLRELIIGYKIKDIIVREPKLIAYPEKDIFMEKIKGKKIRAITRRGKYILIKLEKGITLVIHLRMTGRLLVKDRERIYDKHTHLIFQLEDMTDLLFHDVRKFGRLYLVEDNNWDKAGSLALLGPEPLADDFTLGVFKERINSHKVVIKSLLLNQQFIAGLGNIYADEALFRAGIAPKRKTDTLTDKEIANLYYAVRKVLELGIKYGGTTFSDYRNAKGEEGAFQKRLLVYKRAGEKCSLCGQEILREKIGGRSSHYCPNCQK